MTDPVWNISKPMFSIKTGHQQILEYEVKELTMRAQMNKPFTELVKVLN